jgi:glycosyltransferase involved in cell wall biosynthesis
VSLRYVQEHTQAVPDTLPSFAAVRASNSLPSRILHIGKFYRPHTGGMETYLANLVSHQSSHVPVQVVVANDHPATQTEMLDGARITRVASFGVIASQPICPSLPWNLIGHADALVHLHLPNPWAAHAYLLSGHHSKLVVTHHADTLGRPYLRKLVDPFVRRVMQRADAVIVSSRRYLEGSEELVPFRNKCYVVPMGIDLRAFQNEKFSATSEIYKKYGQRLLLTVGRLVPYKGFEFLIRAMKQVDATLLIIGTGPLQSELETLIVGLGLKDKVHLLGHVEDALPYYQVSRMFLFPSISRAESFGLVQVEAMAAGLPVINTEIDSGAPEVSLHGVTGITVPPRDSNALAGAIKILLANEETRLKYARAAIVRACQEFSIQRMADRTMDLYKFILGANADRN